jgi:hypothetical protein
MRARFRSLKVANAIVLAAGSLVRLAAPANAQPGEVPFVPGPQLVAISNHITAGMVWVDVRIRFPDTCERLGDWGTPIQTLPTISVNSTCWYRPYGACAFVIVSTNHSYQLGYLAPGNYQFVFGACGQTVATNAFTVPNTDSDGDGMPDYQEGIAGTDPWNSNSALRMIGYKLEGGQARITWQGGTNARQYVERRANLNNTNTAWLCVFTNHPPTSVTNAWVDPLGANGARFYRIRVER